MRRRPDPSSQHLSHRRRPSRLTRAFRRAGHLVATAARYLRARASLPRPRLPSIPFHPLYTGLLLRIPRPRLHPPTLPRVRPIPGPHLLAFAIFGGITLAFTFPLITDLSSRIDARFDGINPFYILSTLEWERFALFHARDEFFGGNIFFGSGESLFSSDLLLGALPLFLTFRVILPPVAAFNLLYLVAFLLNASLMYLAVHTILRNRPAAFVAGFIFAFAPLPLHHATHIQLVFAWWIPLTLLFAIRFARYLRARDFALAVLLTGIAFVTAVQIGLIAAIVLIAFGLVPGLMLAFRRRVWRPPLLAFLATVIATAPFVPIVLGYLDFAEMWGTERTSDQVVQLAARIPDYLSPGDRYRWLGFLTKRSVADAPERTLLPGFIPVILAIVGARLGFARNARLRGLTVITLLVAALALLLAAGVRVQWPRFDIDWPLPYSVLLDSFAPLQAFPAVGRFTLLLNFSLAILAAAAIHHLALRTTGRLPAWSVGAVAALLILIESFPIALPTSPVPTDDDLQAVLESGSRGPTLILPMTHGLGLHTRIWANTLAGNGPLVYGYSPGGRSVLDGYDRAFIGMSSAEMDDTVTALRAAGVRRLVILRDQLDRPDTAAWAELDRHALVTTVVNSGDATLYELAGASLPPTSAWSNLDAGVSLQVAVPDSTLKVPLILTNPGPDPWVPAGDTHRRVIRLSFRDANENALTSSAASFMPPPFIPFGESFDLPLSLLVPAEPGRYTLTASIDGEPVLSKNVLVDAVASP